MPYISLKLAAPTGKLIVALVSHKKKFVATLQHTTFRTNPCGNTHITQLAAT